MSPEVNIYFLAKAYLSYKESDIQHTEEYLLKSKLTKNLSTSDYARFMQSLHPELALSAHTFASFIEFIVLRFIACISNKQPIVKNNHLHLILKVSDINAFRIFANSYLKISSPVDEQGQLLEPGDMVNFKHLLLIRNPFYICNSLNKNPKPSMPGIKMGWKGNLFVLYTLDKCLSAARKINAQIIDYDQFFQQGATFTINGIELSRRANDLLQDENDYQISSTEISLHPHALEPYIDPLPVSNLCEKPLKIDNISTHIFFAVASMFPSISQYTPKYALCNASIQLSFQKRALRVIGFAISLPQFLISFLFYKYRNIFYKRIFNKAFIRVP